MDTTTQEESKAAQMNPSRFGFLFALFLLVGLFVVQGVSATIVTDALEETTKIDEPIIEETTKIDEPIIEETSDITPEPFQTPLTNIIFNQDGTTS